MTRIMVRWKISTPRMIVAFLPSYCHNYQNWRKFDEVLIKTNLHSFLRHGVVPSGISQLIAGTSSSFLFYSSFILLNTAFL